jgi:hypothetical protein
MVCWPALSLVTRLRPVRPPAATQGPSLALRARMGLLCGPRCAACLPAGPPEVHWRASRQWHLAFRALIRVNPSQGNARIQVFARSGCRRKGGRRDAPGRLVRRRCTCGADCRRRDFTMPNRYRTLGHRFAVANAPQRRSAWQARESDARDGVPAAARSPARTSTPTSTREPLGPSGLRRRTRHVVAYDSHHFRKRQSPRRTQPAASGSTHADPVRFAFFRARRAFGAG